MSSNKFTNPFNNRKYRISEPIYYRLLYNGIIDKHGNSLLINYSNISKRRNISMFTLFKLPVEIIYMIDEYLDEISSNNLRRASKYFYSCIKIRSTFKDIHIIYTEELTFMDCECKRKYQTIHTLLKYCVLCDKKKSKSLTCTSIKRKAVVISCIDCINVYYYNMEIVIINHNINHAKELLEYYQKCIDNMNIAIQKENSDIQNIKKNIKSMKSKMKYQQKQLDEAYTKKKSLDKYSYF